MQHLKYIILFAKNWSVSLWVRGVGSAVKSGGRGNCEQNVVNERRIYFQRKK